MNHFIRDTRILVLLALLGFLGRAEGATTLISCPPTGGGIDPISHAFYIPSYPGVSLRDLTMSVSSDMAETDVFTLTAHADTFDGPVLGSAAREIALTGDATSPVPVTFSFGGSSPMPAPKGRTVAFVVNRQGPTLAYSPGNLFFATGAAGACSAVETNDSSPPLSGVKGSVPVTVTGDAAPVSLVPNSTFDTGVSGWTISPLSTATGTLTFSPTDADGSPTSGSALLTKNPGVGLFEIQGCVANLLPGVYTFGGSIRYSSPGTSVAYLATASSNAPDCSNLTPLYFSAVPGDGAWHALPAGTGVPIGIDGGIGIKSMALQLTIDSDALGDPVQAYFDDVFVRPTQLSTLTVLGAASIHGRAGSFFHTDLWVLNRSYTETINVTPQFRCFGIACGAVHLSPFSLAPREQKLFSDVVGNSFLSPEVAGTIELSWDPSLGSMSAWARTYSPTAPAPTNGTGIPALASSESRARAVFIGLASNGGNLDAGFRSNVGVYNPSPTPANVTLSLFDDSGNPLGSVGRTLAGFEAFQFNDIFAAVGAGGTVAKQSTLVLTSNVPIFSFVTVIDNQTNDSSFLLPTDDEPPPP